MEKMLNQMGLNAKNAAKTLCNLSIKIRNKTLTDGAAALLSHTNFILEANAQDIKNAKASGMGEAMLDRLTLNKERVSGMANGLLSVADLDDPIGEMISMKTTENGLTIGQKRVPMGVIAMIYEARPNVTADAFALCFKASNAVILRGGKEAIHSNVAIGQALQKALEANGLPMHAIQVVEDTSRETAVALMKLNQYIDVIIPRGGGGLIQSVVENSTIPVIETGVGNCHIFVDKTADFKKAIAIVINAKVQRPSVCNACEKLLVHENIATEFLPLVCAELKAYNVEIRGDEASKAIVPTIIPATQTDWSKEYSDYIIATKIVSGLDGALAHIGAYSSGHSEAILTESYSNSQRFLNEVDSACVYVNASTRFTDGEQFGFGAEIGISTQKLHVRGPMGLQALTSTKYIIYGDGQIRP